MPKLQRLRALAFHAQHGRCYYCSAPMWLPSPEELALRSRTAALFQCTAEHLIARCDGGRHTIGNVVAACLLCNLRRHRRKTPPAPPAYQALVRRRIESGRWWPPGVAKAAKLAQFTTS